MILIVGLGNPEPKYEHTWHNLGFRVVDHLRDQSNSTLGAWKTKPQAEVCEGTVNGCQVVLAKPQTYMNLSGPAVAKLCERYQIEPANLWVVHDEFDLPLGRIKITADASAAGHRGVESIIATIQTSAFLRFRIGIATPRAKATALELYVLQKPTGNEVTAVTAAIQRTVEAIPTALDAGPPTAMNQHNGK